MNETRMKYFCDMNGETVELEGTYELLPPDRFRAMFPGVRGLKDGSSRYITMRGPAGERMPLTRRINYKCRPSLHVCNARCMGGKCGGVCECACGGRNHGINNA